MSFCPLAVALSRPNIPNIVCSIHQIQHCFHHHAESSCNAIESNTTVVLKQIRATISYLVRNTENLFKQNVYSKFVFVHSNTFLEKRKKVLPESFANTYLL